MIFDHVGTILLWAAQIAIVAIVFVALVYPVRRARQKRLPPPRWKATVVQACKYSYDYDQYSEPVRGEVSVRVVRPNGSLNIGTVRTDDDDFEEKLNSLVAAAEDRANALNAAEEILR